MRQLKAKHVINAHITVIWSFNWELYSIFRHLTNWAPNIQDKLDKEQTESGREGEAKEGV